MALIYDIKTRIMSNSYSNSTKSTMRNTMSRTSSSNSIRPMHVQATAVDQSKQTSSGSYKPRSLNTEFSDQDPNSSYNQKSSHHYNRDAKPVDTIRPKSAVSIAPIVSEAKESSDDILPSAKTISKPKSASMIKPNSVSTQAFTCTMCGNDHKFSPFNVTAESWAQLPDILPMMVVDEKSGYYTVCGVRNHASKCYRRLDVNTIDQIIVKNPIKNLRGCAVYWTDGIDLFGNNGLIKMLVMKPDLIESSTIEGLVKMIYCPQWWETFLQNVIETQVNGESYADTIFRAKSYFELMNTFATATGKIVKDHKFSYYEATLRKYMERQKRINEEKQYNDREAIRIHKEEEARRQLQESLEAIRQQELAELNDDSNDVMPIMSFEDRFLASITTERKGTSCKFLAAINPDSNVFANIVQKAGEASKLQSGVDSEDRLRKVAVWEYYSTQTAEMAKGIKYKDYEKGKKKTESVFPEIPVNSDPKKPKALMTLNTAQKMQYKKIWDDYQAEVASGAAATPAPGTFVLDPWQKTSTDLIRQNLSCLITGPTSGGKTYVMMKGMDNIINGDEEQIVVYVSPTFHLAYQTYANVKATFPKRSVAMVTAELVSIPTNAKIIIGTAPQLLNYFNQTKKRFQVGIFDEIHVALSIYYDQTSKSEVIRAKAYKRLIAKCEKQLIAASATIGNPELLQRFIAEKMSSERTDGKVFRTEDIHLVQYFERAIPLNEYRFVNNSTIHPLMRDTTGTDVSVPVEITTEADLSPANLFKLLTQMRRRDMTPSIVFESTDDIAWRTYVDLINYVESLESVDYSPYSKMIERLNDTIDRFNTERDARMDSLPESDNTDNSKLCDGKKGNGRREAGLGSIRSSRVKTYRSMISDAKSILARDIVKYNNEEYVSQCNIPLEVLTELRVLSKIALLFETNSEGLLKMFPDFHITKAHIDMMQIIKRLEDVEHEHTDPIVNIILDKGSHYRFANSCGMDQLKAIREPGSDEDKWKLRKTMIILAEAQHINPKDIDGIIDVVMRGLEFGIAIINPSLPFVIQNIILENLRTKNMGVVIASESMSMGINYPLRSVVIKSSEAHETAINEAKMIQMAGRCGRRGKDNQAHVIYWGVTNADRANAAFIPQLTADSPDFQVNDGSNSDAGSMIDNQVDLATKIGLIFNTFYFYEERKKPVLKASATKTGGRIKESRNSNSHKSSSADYQADVETEEDRERKICEARSNGVKLSRSQYIEPTIKMLALRIGYTEEEAIDIADMVCKIEDNIIAESFSVNSFQKSRHINLITHMLIELHNSFAMTSNIDFLKFLEEMVTVLQIVEYRLVKLAN
jgi:DEAD/DEAH box helicase/Helicase conserved C-terminal domain